jgi:aldehyde:ferredoxin oxidoreductase
LAEEIELQRQIRTEKYDLLDVLAVTGRRILVQSLSDKISRRDGVTSQLLECRTRVSPKLNSDEEVETRVKEREVSFMFSTISPSE